MSKRTDNAAAQISQPRTGSGATATPTDDQFRPAPREAGEAEIISRPALTYWQDAMMRLRQDKLAMSCFVVIVVICLIGILGPFFFPPAVNGIPYENQQNPNNIDQDPSRGGSVLVVNDKTGISGDVMAEGYDNAAPLAAVETLPAPATLKLDGELSVNGVTMHWDPVPAVSGYIVYRTIVPTGGTVDTAALADGSIERGVALTEIDNGAQVSFTDALGLDSAERYAYTVVPYVTNDQTFQKTPGPKGATVVADLGRTIKLSDALTIDPKATVGATIQSRAHWFGTDGLGRDVLARMIEGTRVDMLLALLVPTFSILIGMVFGAISGLIGKKVDLVMMRIVEIVDNFPDLLVFILLQVAFGKGALTLFVALTVFSWAGFARIVRGEVLRLREIEFVQASRLLGAPIMRLVTRHIGPNLLGLIIIAWSARIPTVIATEAFLSMLGLGLEQPAPSWGNVVFDSARRLQVSPIQFFLPASVLGVTLLAFYLLGNSLRDAFDPKLRGRT